MKTSTSGRRHIPTIAVKKWQKYISMSPSVGPFIAGRIRVLVKKLDQGKQISINFAKSLSVINHMGD